MKMKLFNKILGVLFTDDTVVCTFADIPVIMTSYYKIFLLSLCGIVLFTEGIVSASALFVILSIVYFFVVCHEYGHSLMAKKFGYKVANIALYPYGGIASVEGGFEHNNKHEFWIAVAGPLVNVVFGLLFIPLAFMFAETDLVNLLFLLCLKVNAILLFFNLLPLYPLDGGRICKTLIGMNITKKWAMKATGIVTVVTSLFAAPVLWIYGEYVGSIFVAVLFVGNLIYLIWGDKIKSRNGGTCGSPDLCIPSALEMYDIIIERSENSLDRASKVEQFVRFLEVITDGENVVYIKHLSNKNVQDHLFVILGIGLPDNKVISLWKENISTNILLESV